MEEGGGWLEGGWRVGGREGCREGKDGQRPVGVLGKRSPTDGTSGGLRARQTSCRARSSILWVLYPGLLEEKRGQDGQLAGRPVRPARTYVWPAVTYD